MEIYSSKSLAKLCVCNSCFYQIFMILHDILSLYDNFIINSEDSCCITT